MKILYAASLKREIALHYRIPKGVFDILPTDPEAEWRSSGIWNYLEQVIRQLAFEFGFEEIRTPLFETTELFTRSIGTSSDIVTKEMYTFQDKGGRSLTLRPEGTAPVMRALIEKSLFQQKSLHKLFYILPMFRYERQQAGRYRQHHQFGVEVVGTSLPEQDVEVIHLLWTLYERLGIRNLTLHLNSIGNEKTRQAYRHALKMFLRPHVDKLSTDSQTRYEVNPLRILDSKDPHDQKLLEQAPQIIDFLDESGKAHFERVCSLLNKLRIPVFLNPKLVRGLDYYNDTVFEITSEQLGAQNSLGGGGRYDGLVEQLGGPSTPAFGFGAGLERIIQTLLAQKGLLPSPIRSDLFLIPLGEAATERCFLWMAEIRSKQLPLRIEMDTSGKKLKAALRYADAIKARFVAVIGEDELQTGLIELKHMDSGKKLKPLSFDRIIDAIQTHPQL